MDWIMTDDDSFQICRYLESLSEKFGDSVYEFYQIQEFPNWNSDNNYRIAHQLIFCSEIDVNSVLNCYGYKSLEDLKNICGDSYKQILAQCNFELTSGCLKNIISPTNLSWDSAVDMICELSGYKQEE